MLIKNNMAWPPMNLLSWKMAEHSAWYSGSSELLANFYFEYACKNVMNLPYNKGSMGEGFWGRQLQSQGETYVHVPIAGDISETSANLLFSEAPRVKIPEASEKNASVLYKDTQKELETMLIKIGFHHKLLEAAESCSAIGGIYIKLAWDEDITQYPIPVIMQADKAVPEFKFGILTAVTFWKVIEADDSGSKVLRLIERYSKGRIEYTLYKGTHDRVGTPVNLDYHDETKDLPDVLTTVDELLAFYIPNMLPNRLNRNSYLGRSDYSGVEGLMDSLDEVYTSWIKEINLARARVLLPESFIENKDGSRKFNIDRSLYVSLDIDPVSNNNNIVAQQFEIRADEFEKSSMNLIERIVTSAGYSPQSFGLNIQGRAESGTALTMRERKSFTTKAKKQSYWQDTISSLVHKLMLVYNKELSGKMETNIDINVEFSDSITNDLGTTATSLKMLSDAQSASIETRVKILHPEWEKEQIESEVKRIKEENSVATAPNPDRFEMGDLDANEDGA